MEFFLFITLNIVTHSSESDEIREMLVQLTEDDLKSFREQFERLDKKLTGLKDRCASLLARKEGESR